MPVRVIASLIICVSFALNSVPGILGKPAFVPASFEGYTMTLADGESLDMHLVGGSIVFNSSVSRDYDVVIAKVKTMRAVKTFSKSGTSFEVDCSGAMNEGELYYVDITYEAFGLTVNVGNNIIFKQGKKLYFFKSDSYAYNTEACSELWTDEQSLKECLEPQNDVECDDPVLIEYSNKICAGASGDWEKVFRIYIYIAHQMAYDNDEIDGGPDGHQDSAVDILRDGKGICEGFANCFTALCRAQGIPAVVEYGMGLNNYDEITTRTFSDSDFADHAWAAVYLGGAWRFVDPTYDMSRYYDGPGKVKSIENTTTYYLLPLESFSNDHRILDADTRHGIECAGYCGDNAFYQITRDGVCHISGEGTVKMPAGKICYSKVVFDEGSNITEIGTDCFEDCDLLTCVVLPDTVKRIDDYAFNTCEDLEYVYIPEGVTYIGDQAFSYCDELAYVRIPDSVYSIGSWAFDNCPRLYISIPSSLSGFDSDYDRKPMYIECR